MLRKLYVPLFALLLLFNLVSCNGKDEKTSKETVSTDTASSMTSTEPVAASTIVTTPQHMVIAKHRVGSYAKWKASYDAPEHDSLRLANGLHSYVIGQSPGDPNMLLVVLKADDPAKAKAFAKDPALKKAMQKGGVMGTPVISQVTTVWQDTATLTGPIRSMTTFTVKDWATWEKSFLEGTQERKDNGIVARTYGHDADNDKKITLVTAIIDSAKAAAYWKSDMLKKRRAAGGVIGEPDRFLFRIVQRY
jgi:hypothetical protein